MEFFVNRMVVGILNSIFLGYLFVHELMLVAMNLCCQRAGNGVKFFKFLLLINGKLVIIAKHNEEYGHGKYAHEYDC